MNKQMFDQFRRLLPGKAAAIAIALAATPLVLGTLAPSAATFIASAHAEEEGSHAEGGHSGGHSGGHDSAEGHDHEDGGSGKKGPGYRGGKGELPRGEGGSLEDNVYHSDGGTEEGHAGGHGGPGEDSEGKGPHYGGGGNADATHGGKPVWAQEGIPEVELGRLNVGRAPAHVLARALNESLSGFSTDMVSFYSQTAEAAAAELKTDYATVARIDSPVQNLALYQELLKDGGTQLPGVTPASRNDLAAILLGSASDKTKPISEDTVKAISIILGVENNLSAGDVTQIQEKAEDVRAAILEGHGTD